MITTLQEQGGIRYEREGYMYGGGWKSRERGVPLGTVREINGILSVAWVVYKRGLFGLGTPEVLWKNVDPRALRDVPITERP